MLDVGANVDSDASNLVQFAIMGEQYVRNVLRVERPTIGLLSIGEEDSKGNALTRETLERAEHYVHQLQKYTLHATMERD